MKEYKFYVESFGEYAAGILGYVENITIIVENDPGGEEYEFEEFMMEALKEWFDDAHVERKEDADKYNVELSEILYD